MTFLEQSPVFRVLIPFALGIVTFYFSAPFQLLTVALLLGLFSVLISLLLSKRLSKNFKSVAILGASYLIGIVLSYSVHPEFKSEHRLGPPKTKQAYCFVVQQIKNASTAFNKYEALAYDSSQNKYNVLLYVSKQHALELVPNDTIFATCNLQQTEAPKNPYQFDYQNYLSLHDIHYTALIGKNSVPEFSLNQNFSLYKYTVKVRHYCKEIFDKFQFSSSEKALLNALLLGDKSELSDETIQQFSSAGAMHVLAVSGLHVGIFYLVIQFLLQFLGESATARIVRVVIQVSFLWSYALLTGLTPSVTRSATMFTFVAVGAAMQSRTSVYNSIAVSALLLLIVNPFTLFEVGFQLSYAAVLGIIAFHAPIYSWFKSSNKILDYCWNISAVSISAQLATFPLGLLYFHSFPNYFLVSNLVVINCAAFILYGTLALLVFGFTSHIGFTISYGIKAIMYVQNLVVGFVDALPGATMNAIHITNSETVLLYCIVGFLLYALVNYSRQAVYWSLGLTVIFIGLLGLENWQLKQTNKLIFYSGGPNTSFEYISGFNHIFMSDEAFYSNTSSLSYAVYQHWFALNLNEPKVQFIPQDSNSVFTIADSIKVAVCTSKPLNLKDSVDYLVVANFYSNRDLENTFQWVRKRIFYNKPLSLPRENTIKKDLPRQVFLYKLYQNKAFEIQL